MWIYFTYFLELLADNYLRMYNNSEIQKTLYGTEKKVTKAQIINWISNNLRLQKSIFSLIEQGTGDFLRIIEVIIRENGVGEISISLLPDKQGKGYGKETVATVLKYGYEKLGLNDFELFVYKSN